jgi:hypothetical protein
MKLSQIEANWIASKLLSDAERERERAAERRTAWLATLFPTLKFVRPTERLSVLRSARLRAAREPMILWPSLAGILLFATLFIGVPKQSRPAWLALLLTGIVAGIPLAQYLRTRAILRIQHRSLDRRGSGR